MPTPHYLVATDFSPNSIEALQQAIADAQHSGARVTLLHVVPQSNGLRDLDSIGYLHQASQYPVAPVPTDMQHIHRQFAAQLAEIKPQLLEVETALRSGNPATEIVQFAKDQDVRTIYVGASSSSSRIYRLLASVSDYILQKAQCRVIAIRSATTR